MLDFISSVIIIAIIVICIYSWLKNEAEKMEAKEAEDISRREELSRRQKDVKDWPQHPLFQAVELKVLEFIDDACNKAKSVPIGRDNRDLIVIKLSDWQVQAFEYGSVAKLHIMFNTYGYDNITSDQVETFCQALFNKLRMAYLDNPGINVGFDVGFVSGKDTLNVDITQLHPRYKGVEI